MATAQQLQETAEWLDRVVTDVTQLMTYHHVFREVKNMAAAHPQVSQLSSVFFSWMQDCYITYAGMAIRKQVDRDSKSLSLVGLLLRLRGDPSLVSRAYFVNRGMQNTTLPADYFERGYDGLVGPGRSELDPDQIDREIATLDGQALLFRALANKKLAHASKVTPKQLPTFHDFESCVKSFEETILRYLVLVKGHSMSTLFPTFQYDWMEIFRYPWIPPSGETM